MKKNYEPQGFWSSNALKKSGRIMRFTIFLLLVFALNTVASESYSQKANISLNLKNTTIEKALDEIEKQSGFVFLYSQEVLNMDKVVDLSLNKKDVYEVLAELFKDDQVKFTIIDNKIILSSNQTTSTISQNQPIKISGKVTDTNGEALPGVNVYEKTNPQNGVITGIDGTYSIELDAASDVLKFSFIGYEDQEVTVETSRQINITLMEETTGLDEVVVVGYGTMRKSDLTGSIARVQTDKTADLRNANVLQSLKGSVAGISIGTPDMAGEDPTFKIRGTNSINAGNSPLIVVDGIIFYGSLNALDVNDIESVDVLKDASSAAVYGSRSSNGVVIVTTKKGRKEKPTFNFGASYGVSNPVKLIDMLSPEQYQQKILDHRIAKGMEADPSKISEYMSLTEANNLAAGRTIDWYDKLIQTSNTQNYTGSFSGGTDKTEYYISGSYYNQEGIVENDEFERITARINFANQITDWFKVRVNSSFANMDYSGIPVSMSYALSPYSNWYENADPTSGKLEYYPMEDPYFRHPYLNLQIDDHDVTTEITGLVSTEIDVPWVKGFKWTMNYSINQRTKRKYRFDNSYLEPNDNGSAYKQIDDFLTWTWDNIYSYNRTFKDVHAINGTFLISKEFLKAGSTNASATDFFNQSMGYNGLDYGAVPLASSSYGEQVQSAIMGRINYVYDNKYAITATARRDGFSGFSENHKYATFISSALAWTISRESFMADMDWLDLLKLRVSYGENGNQAIGRYMSLAHMDNTWSWGANHANYLTPDGGSTANGMYASQMANSDLTWETTESFNIGLDFNILNSKLYGNIEYYNSNTKDLLIKRSLPALTGYQSVWSNLGRINNKGIEIALNSQILSAGALKWDVGLTFDLNRNSIEELFGEDLDGDGKEDDVVANSWFIGQPLGVYYGYGIDGIHQLDDTNIPEGYVPGDFRIVDYDKDGEITADDRYVLGNTLPNYQFSISNTLRYKNFSLYAMINSIQGGGKDNYYMGNNKVGHNPNEQFPSWSERFSFPAMDYWTPDNPSNTAARIDYVAPRGHTYLEDRSFVRLQDVILSYTVDSSITSRWGLGEMRVYVSGKNLYTWTDWTGYDPENATTIYNSPMMRTFTFGLDLKF